MNGIHNRIWWSDGAVEIFLPCVAIFQYILNFMLYEFVELI